jgi:hypothetical protein
MELEGPNAKRRHAMLRKMNSALIALPVTVVLLGANVGCDLETLARVGYDLAISSGALGEDWALDTDWSDAPQDVAPDGSTDDGDYFFPMEDTGSIASGNYYTDDPSWEGSAFHYDSYSYE